MKIRYMMRICYSITAWRYAPLKRAVDLTAESKARYLRRICIVACANSRLTMFAEATKKKSLFFPAIVSRVAQQLPAARRGIGSATGQWLDCEGRVSAFEGRRCCAESSRLHDCRNASRGSAGRFHAD